MVGAYIQSTTNWTADSVYSTNCGLTYRRVLEVEESVSPLANHGKRTQRVTSWVHGVVRTNRSTPQLSRGFRQRRNDLQIYQPELGGFKRIWILSIRETIPKQLQSDSTEMAGTRINTKDDVNITQCEDSTAKNWARTLRAPSAGEEESLSRAEYEEDASSRSLSPSVLESAASTLSGRFPKGMWTYYFPTTKDEELLNLEDMKHAMLELLCKEIFFAPVKHLLDGPSRIIDMGTGCGMWAIDGAELVLIVDAES